MFVLGIDPGLSRCGYGLIETGGPGSRRQGEAVLAGVLRTDPSDRVPLRLLALRDDLCALLCTHRPDVVAVERVLFQSNARTAIPVAQAAGVVMVEAQNAGCQVVEYSPNQVKQSVTGAGAADKQQVQRMVQTLLGMTHPLRPADAADALAVALCHVAHAPLNARLANDASGGVYPPSAADTRPQNRRRLGVP
jgi:crossover junction endodeoxyribonuclease RuvC